MTMNSSDLVAVLVAPHEPPCLSLYQPAASLPPEQKRDRIVFRNLVDSLAEQLRRDHPARTVDSLLAPFRALGEDALFWTRPSPGLAVFGGRDLFHVQRLPRPVPELAVVSDTFHVKPLLRILQSIDRFHVLGLTRRTAKLFEGDRDRIERIEVDPAVPTTLEEALGRDVTEPHRSVWGSPAPARGEGIVFGMGDKQDEVDVDTDRFFRAVDRAVFERYSRATRQPLLLLALKEYHSFFRRISINPYLLETGIEADPDALTLEELRRRAWQVMEPRYRARLASLVEAFGAARAHARGAADIADIAAAAAQSRVATLLVEAERHIPGRLDPTFGRIEMTNGKSPMGDDLLDDVAELVLRRGGEVIVVPTAAMPTETGAAAIYRF